MRIATCLVMALALLGCSDYNSRSHSTPAANEQRQATANAPTAPAVNEGPARLPTEDTERHTPEAFIECVREAAETTATAGWKTRAESIWQDVEPDLLRMAEAANADEVEWTPDKLWSVVQAGVLVSGADPAMTVGLWVARGGDDWQAGARRVMEAYMRVGLYELTRQLERDRRARELER